MEQEICIIGAGISGIAAARALQKTRLPFVWYEAGSRAGGLWWYGNDNGMSHIYQSLHTNTSKERSGFAEYPMSDDMPDFPHHSQVLTYLSDFLDRFELTEHVQTRHRVVRVIPSEKGGYSVTVEGPDGTPQIGRFKTVVVCNGHHWDPFLPELPGEFEGKLVHSSEYREPSDFNGKKVLVVGAGNSACDIACDLAKTADVSMSTRSGAHVVPKYILGRPLDHWSSEFTSRLPLGVQRKLFSLLVFLARGSQHRYDFPVPDAPFLSSHPTISSDVLNAVGHGRIRPRPDIELLDGEYVRFRDGEVERFDAIILATGYSVSFPFFEAGFMPVSGNDVSLYHLVVHPSHDDMFFIGLLQPLGPLAPLAEAQANWVAALLTGAARLPSRDEMWDSIKRDKEERDKLFTATRRHTLEVEFFRYLRRMTAAAQSSE